MGFADVWNRTLVYFGIAEEDDEWDEDGYLTEEDLERTYSERPNVRRLTPRGRQRDFDDWTDPDPEEAAPATAVLRPRNSRRSAEAPAAAAMRAIPSVQVHLVVPRSFNDAQQIADKFKDGIPVILNLQGADQELSKRLIDFTSGLTYALDGGMQRVADKVFLLTATSLLADAASTANTLIDTFLWVYVLLIFVYILTSWVRMPYTIWVRRITDFLRDVCEPYLRIFRRILPPLGPLDLSPVVATLALIALIRVIDALFAHYT
jgi:cell division inhibitor SepF